MIKRCVSTVLRSSKGTYSNAFCRSYDRNNTLLLRRSTTLFADQNEKNANDNGRRSIYGVAVTSKMGCIKKMHCPIMSSSLISPCSIFTLINKQETSTSQITWPIRNLAAICRLPIIYCWYVMFILYKNNVIALYGSATRTKEPKKKNQTTAFGSKNFRWIYLQQLTVVQMSSKNCRIGWY